MSDEPISEGALLAEQLAYYRARAAEYDEWWFRRGRYDRGAELNAAWFADVAAVENALFAFIERTRPQSVLELACGTGLFTRHLARRVAHVTGIDASPEAIEHNRARVSAANVDYIIADLFEWMPAVRYDLVFMSFWLSHVPMTRFERFWTKVRQAIAPPGHAYVIDNAFEPTSTARDHPRPDPQSGIATRKLNDGKQYRIVKLFHDADTLTAQLLPLGFDAHIERTPRPGYFIHGFVRTRS